MQRPERGQHFGSLLVVDRRKEQKQYKTTAKQGQALRQPIQMQMQIVRIQNCLAEGVQVFDKPKEATTKAEKRRTVAGQAEIDLKKIALKSRIYWDMRRFILARSADPQVLTQFFAQKRVRDCIERTEDTTYDDCLSTLQTMLPATGSISAISQKALEIVPPVPRNRHPFKHEKRQRFTVYTKAVSGANVARRLHSATAPFKREKDSFDLAQVLQPALLFRDEIPPLHTKVNPSEVQVESQFQSQSQSLFQFQFQLQSQLGHEPKQNAYGDSLDQVGYYAKRLSLTQGPNYRRTQQESIHKSTYSRTLGSAFPHRSSASKAHCERAATIMHECNHLSSQCRRTQKKYVQLKQVLRRSMTRMKLSMADEHPTLTRKELNRILAREINCKRCFIYGRNGKGRFLNLTTTQPPRHHRKTSEKDRYFAEHYLRSLAS